jgi:hypothetical protein
MNSRLKCAPPKLAGKRSPPKNSRPLYPPSPISFSTVQPRAAGRRLRQFVWSLWNESHLINLFDLCHGLDGPLTEAVIVFHAALVGVLSEEHLRRLLIESGEMARWDSAQGQTPEHLSAALTIIRAFRANRKSMFAWRSSLLGRRTHSPRDRAPRKRKERSRSVLACYPTSQLLQCGRSAGR